MASEQDATEFVDENYPPEQPALPGAGAGWSPAEESAPTLEEVDSQVTEKQQKLAELRRAQEELERERAALEETRRRQMEFKKGREEMLQSLTRGIGLLEESELTARRNAELAARTLADFKDALAKVQGINETHWTKENFGMELTRALTTIENARMEWNSARVKLPVLAGKAGTETAGTSAAAPAGSPFASLSFWQLCKVGLGLNWPLLLVALAALGVFLAILATRR
jgi:hypothetical protein